MSNPTQLKSANLRFALYSSSIGNYFFHEIRDLIAAGLRELGHAVELRDEKNGFTRGADWQLVVAPHEFFHLGKGEALATKPLPENLVLFNTEQPSTKWFELAAKHFAHAAALWDIDFESSLRISKGGHPCSYLPLGHAGEFAMFQQVRELPLHEETQRLPADVRNGDFFERPFVRRPLDLLFLGHASARREEFFARHAARLNPFRNYLYRPTVMRPLIPGETTNMNTLTSIGLAQRSKILLNVHHGVDKYFEWHRIVLLGIAQRTLVLTEPCSLAAPFQANADFVEAPLDELAARADYHLRSEAGQREAQAIIGHSYETLTRRCRIVDMLRPLVVALQERSRLDCTSASHLVSPATSPAPNAEPLSICVVTPDLAGKPSCADASASQVALAEQFAAQGHLVTLLHTRHEFGIDKSHGYWSLHFAARNIHYVALPPDLDVPVKASEAAARSYETYLWLRKRAFDVVHAPETDGIGLYSLLARNQGLDFERTRFCLNSHGPRVWRRQASELFVTSPYDLELDFMERECFRLADALVTSTEFMSGWLEQQKWALPAARSLRRDRLESVARADASASTPVRTLVYPGSLERSSELEIFCQAIERLDRPSLQGVEIVFQQRRMEKAGVKGAEYLHRRLRHWKLAWRVTEYDSSEALFQQLAQPVSLTVITSPQENSPWLARGCLEHGAKFLATNGGGVPELILAEDHAAALFALRPSALAGALRAAIEQGAVQPRPAAGVSNQIAIWLDAHVKWVREPHAPIALAGEEHPLVSVCLVHFNRPEYLKQALASLRAQDYPNFEVILVDDGSTKSEAIAFLASLEPEFKGRGWQIVRQENRYLGAARNTGARHARGDYLVFMDDDNVAKPHELSTFIRVARKTGADLLTSSMDVFTGANAPGLQSKPCARWVFLGAAAATGAIRNCFGDANGCIRRDAFWRVGGFTEEYGITHEDWEFYAKATLQGCRMETVPESLFWYRTAAGSMIHSTPIHANLQRSLRPYIAALPEPLGGLMRLIQGTVGSQGAETITVPDYHDLLALHQSLLSAGNALNQLGRKSEAEAIFLKVLHSADTIGHAGLLLGTLMSAAVTLAQAGGHGVAKALLERAAKLAGMLEDQVAIAEVGLMQESLAAGENLEAVGVRIKLIEPGSPVETGPATKGPALRGSLPHEQRSAAVPAASSNGVPPLATPRKPTGGDAFAATDAPLASIIILTHNQLPHTQACLKSIAEHTPEPHEIVLVDHGSTDGTAPWLRSYAAERKNIRLIENPDNRGFAAGNNQALVIAKGDFLVLLNNDTLVTPRWLSGLIEVSRQRPLTGLVGPMSNYVSGPQLVPDVPYRNPDTLADFSAKWRTDHSGQTLRVDRLVGFCMLVRREVLDRIGGLDESFGSGNFEDDDYCLRAGLSGFECRIAEDVFVHHTGSQTFKGEKIDYRASLLRNWELFKAKWGIPGHSPIERGYRLPLQLANPSQLRVPLRHSNDVGQNHSGFDHAGNGAPLPMDAPANPVTPFQPPECAQIGQLNAARELLAKKQFVPAWNETLASLRVRPFHPDAFLLLAGIAREAGDFTQARECAEHARDLAPKWKVARNFLSSLNGKAGSGTIGWPDSDLPSKNGNLPPRLTVCLIVKNEERFLARCLESVRDLAHQLVVVDTGSTDRTVEIAKSQGAEVHAFEWCDDFSAARNAALSHATGDWVLVLDADEELPPESRETLRRELQNASVMAYRLPIVDAGKEANGCNYVPRLFRNAPGAYFTGRVHEQAFSSLEAARRTWGLENTLGTARLLHHGYGSEITKSRDKIARNLRLLESALKDAPQDVNLLMNFGLELVRAGQTDEGLGHYHKAFQTLSAMSLREISPELRETLLTQFSAHLLTAGRFENVVRVLKSPLANSAELTASLHFSLGLALVELKQPDEAIVQLRQCIARKNQPALTPVNPDICKAGPHHALAICLARTHQVTAADESFRAGLSADAESRPLRHDFAGFMAQQGKPVEALKLLHQLVSENASDAEAWLLGGNIALAHPGLLEFAGDWTSEAERNLPGHPAIEKLRSVTRARLDQLASPSTVATSN